MISVLETWDGTDERGKFGFSPTHNTTPEGATFWWNNRRAHPLLDADEERALARQIKTGAPHEREAAQKRFLDSNLRLVWVNALAFFQQKPASLCLDDLFQEGCIGLLKATERFDPKRGCRFSTCAVPWIRQAIQRALQFQDRAIRLPVHVHQQRHAALGAAQQLAQNLGYAPNPTELAALLPAHLRPCLAAPWEMISLDIPAYDETQTEPLAETLPDLTWERETPNGQATQSQLRSHIEQLLDQLPTRSARVLSLRYGLGGETEHNYREIGLLLDLHPETIRQIEKSAVKRLSQSPVLQEWAEGGIC